jgi:hypothetical protein
VAQKEAHYRRDASAVVSAPISTPLIFQQFSNGSLYHFRIHLKKISEMKIKNNQIEYMSDLIVNIVKFDGVMLRQFCILN